MCKVEGSVLSICEWQRMALKIKGVTGASLAVQHPGVDSYTYQSANSAPTMLEVVDMLTKSDGDAHEPEPEPEPETSDSVYAVSLSYQALDPSNFIPQCVRFNADVRIMVRAKTQSHAMSLVLQKWMADRRFETCRILTMIAEKV